MIDTAVDWVRASLKMSQQVYIDDLKQTFENTKQEFQTKSDLFDSNYQELLAIADKNISRVKHIEDVYKIDHTKLTQFKQRLISDLTCDMSKMIELTTFAHRTSQSNQKNLDANNKILALLLESNMIDSLI